MLVDFAIALMQTLDTINRESFQRFRLRMGLNHGPVIAGVIGEYRALQLYVRRDDLNKDELLEYLKLSRNSLPKGAQKPQYDIWSNTGN